MNFKTVPNFFSFLYLRSIKIIYNKYNYSAVIKPSNKNDFIKHLTTVIFFVIDVFHFVIQIVVYLCLMTNYY